jgi:DNA end-binding protein Ku
MEQADLEKVRLPSIKVIDVDGFIDASEMDPMLYETPYFVGPDGAVAAKTYALLCEALSESGKMGIGRVVLRDREDMVALSPHDGGLVLYKLRYPNEARSIKDVPEVVANAPVDAEQLKLARNLLDNRTKSMDEIELQDRYGDALRELIEAKIRGKEVVTVGEEPHPVVDIMKTLKQSIDQAKNQRQQMIKATGKPPAEVKPAKGRKRA